MKKILFKTVAVFMASVFLSGQLFAVANMPVTSEDKALVAFSEDEIYSSFDEVAELEAYLAGSDKSYAEVKAEDEGLVENVSSGAAIAMNTATMSDPPIFSAFMWGCLLNVVGIVIVMLTTEMDTHHVMKSFWGCVTSSALYVILWVLSYGMPR